MIESWGMNLHKNYTNNENYQIKTGKSSDLKKKKKMKTNDVHKYKMAITLKGE